MNIARFLLSLILLSSFIGTTIAMEPNSTNINALRKELGTLTPLPDDILAHICLLAMETAEPKEAFKAIQNIPATSKYLQKLLQKDATQKKITCIILQQYAKLADSKDEYIPINNVTEHLGIPLAIQKKDLFFLKKIIPSLKAHHMLNLLVQPVQIKVTTVTHAGSIDGTKDELPIDFLNFDGKKKNQELLKLLLDNGALPTFATFSCSYHRSLHNPNDFEACVALMRYMDCNLVKRILATTFDDNMGKHGMLKRIHKEKCAACTF